MRNALQFGLVLLASALPAIAADTGPAEVRLWSSGKVPDLPVALNIPEGWTVEWYSRGAGPSVARLYREASNGTEAIVVTATESRQGPKSADEVFTPDFLRDTGDKLSARTRTRVKNDFWDGAYFVYDMSQHVAEGTVLAEVRNWMMVANDYLVQFQCYFLKNYSLERDERLEKEDALAQEYRDILFSVRVVAPEEIAKPAPPNAKAPGNAKAPASRR